VLRHSTYVEYALVYKVAQLAIGVLKAEEEQCRTDPTHLGKRISETELRRYEKGKAAKDVYYVNYGVDEEQHVM